MRVPSHSVLRHPLRAAILEAVQAEPGQSLSELRRRLCLAPGTLHHHVTVLVRGKLLRLIGVGKCVAVLPAAERRCPRVLAVLRKPNMAALRDFVASRGRVHQRQIREAFPAPRSTTQYRLQRLVEAQALRAQREGRCVVYSVPMPREANEPTTHPKPPEPWSATTGSCPIAILPSPQSELRHWRTDEPPTP